MITYLTWPPLPLTLVVFRTFSPGRGHTGSMGHHEASPYWGSASRVVTTLEMLLDDIHHEKAFWKELNFWAIIPQPLGQAGGIGDNEFTSSGDIATWPWKKNQWKYILGSSCLSEEILEKAAIDIEDFSINQDGIQCACGCHVYKEKQQHMARKLSTGVVTAVFEGWLILTEDILGWSLHPLGSMTKLTTAGETYSGTEQLGLVTIHDCVGILVELKPWSSWKINDYCDTMTFFQWWFLQNAFSSNYSRTTSSMLQLMSTPSSSSSSILVHALRSSSMMWYLDTMSGRLKKWCPHTHVLQKTTSIIFEAHINLDSSEKALFSVERHSTRITMQILTVGSALELFWSEAAPCSRTRDSLEGGHQLNYVWRAQCVPCCVLEKNIELGKHIHICATANQGMRLCLSDMKPVSHVYHTFILFADNTHKEEPTYRVMITSYATRHNLIYTSRFRWSFSSTRGVSHYGCAHCQCIVSWLFNMGCSIDGNKFKLSPVGTSDADDNVSSSTLLKLNKHKWAWGDLQVGLILCRCSR